MPKDAKRTIVLGSRANPPLRQSRDLEEIYILTIRDNYPNYRSRLN